VETLQALDDAVERVYQTLQATGKLDDTLIIFASDNGYMFGNHRLEGKVRVYDESSRVPLLVRGGPFRGGGQVDSLVSNIDLAPTIVAHTGITPERLMDGIDLAGVVADPAAHANRAILIESVEGPGYAAIRTPTWMWVEYKTGSKELYNMVNDPYQLVSLHRSTALAGVRTTLHGKLVSLLACAGPTCAVTGT
jgi:arylsulfatase A-like enzyme